MYSIVSKIETANLKLFQYSFSSLARSRLSKSQLSKIAFNAIVLNTQYTGLCYICLLITNTHLVHNVMSFFPALSNTVWDTNIFMVSWVRNFSIVTTLVLNNSKVWHSKSENLYHCSEPQVWQKNIQSHHQYIFLMSTLWLKKARL